MGCGYSAETASSFPHGQRSFCVHCGCCMPFSYSCLTPTSRPGAHLTNFHFRWAPVCVRAWVYVCLCEFTVNISTACASHFRVSLERWDGERTTSLPIYGCVGIPPHYSLLQCIPIPRTFGSYHPIAAGGGVSAARAHYLWLMEHCVPLHSNTLIHSRKRRWEMSESQFQFQCKETMMKTAEMHVLVHVPVYNECI